MSRRTIVTGASQPLGMAVVRTPLERGQHVVAIAPRPERVPALTDLAQDVGQRLRIMTGDATHGGSGAKTLGRTGPSASASVHAAVRRQASDGQADL